MKALLPIILILCAPIAFAEVDASGHWEGAVHAPNISGPSKVTLDLARNNHGAWVASLGVPEQNASGLVVSGLSIEGHHVKFIASDVPGNPIFDLTLHEGKLAGTIIVREQSIALEMQRTGEARVELVTPSPAVSSEIEGDWEGALAMTNGESRALLFHFRNLPDHTVSGTLDSPSLGAKALSLAGIVQTGRELEFHVRIYGGSFKGTLNAEGNQLNGQWIQGGRNPVVECRMKKK